MSKIWAVSSFHSTGCAYPEGGIKNIAPSYRVPTAPGKPGKIGPDLENLEKQGVGGQKPGKILNNLEKNF